MGSDLPTYLDVGAGPEISNSTGPARFLVVGCAYQKPTQSEQFSASGAPEKQVDVTAAITNWPPPLC